MEVCGKCLVNGFPLLKHNLDMFFHVFHNIIMYLFANNVKNLYITQLKCNIHRVQMFC